MAWGTSSLRSVASGGGIGRSIGHRTATSHVRAAASMPIAAAADDVHGQWAPM